MSEHDAADAKAVDDLMRSHFRTEPVEDRSGLLAPVPARTSGEPDEQAQFEAYMRRYFPGQRE